MRVCAAVLMMGGKFLICTRPPGGSHAGEWEFPGGKARPGESDAECLRREMLEELDLRVTVLDKLFQTEHRLPEKLIQLHFYRCVPETPECVPDAMEGQEFSWATPCEMAGYKFLPADREFVAFLGNYLKDGQ